MSDGNEEHGPAGVSFGPLKRALREHRYPVSVAELIEQYGGFELETETGSERLETTLERCGETRFREPREVRDAVLEALGAEPRSGEASGAEPGSEAASAGDGGGERENPEGAWSRLST